MILYLNWNKWSLSFQRMTIVITGPVIQRGK